MNDKPKSAAPVIAIATVVAIVLLGVPCLLAAMLFGWLLIPFKGSGPQPTMRPPGMSTPVGKTHDSR